jgi:hypothetical protein
MRAVLQSNAGRHRDLQSAIDRLELELGAGGEPQLISQCLRNYEPPGGVDGSPHGIKIPSKWYASILLAFALASAVMATLHLRNVPAELDAVLTADAKSRGISKNSRAIEALRRGLGLDQVERARLVEAIRRERQPADVDVSRLIRDERPA